VACPAADAGRNWRGVEARVNGLRGAALCRSVSLIARGSESLS
jgi:hypothetical protein